MNLEKYNPDTRELKDIEDVVFDKEWLKTAKSFELYYMYRDLAENEEEYDKIFANNLRYDITIMFPKMLGKEFNKTVGHDHPIVPGTSITYPELYEVLEGEAIFLLQDSENEKIKDVYAIRAKTGNPAPGPGANSIIKSLSRGGFKILNILDTTRLPRGGPKKKGGRRGRRV
mgnify:CR=1 FL=1